MKRRRDHAYQAPVVPSIFGPRDLDKLALSRTQLRSTLRAGEVDQVATICARVPNAIVCLLLALAIHDLGTQQPPDVWIALDRKARKPRFDDIAVRVVRFSGRIWPQARDRG